MKLDLTQFKDGVPEKVAKDLDAKQLDVEYVDLHYKTKIHVEGTAEKILSTLIFRGVIDRTVEHICGRCLKSVDENVREPIDLTYDIKDLLEIDLLDDIRDALLLAHPERFLCRPDCRGLCPSCGVNLNVEQCQCASRSESNPFSELKNWFKEKKNR